MFKPLFLSALLAMAVTAQAEDKHYSVYFEMSTDAGKTWGVGVSTDYAKAEIITPPGYNPTRKDFETLAIIAATTIRDQEKLLKRKDAK